LILQGKINTEILIYYGIGYNLAQSSQNLRPIIHYTSRGKYHIGQVLSQTLYWATMPINNDINGVKIK
jgi:hypothetical protein